MDSKLVILQFRFKSCLIFTLITSLCTNALPLHTPVEPDTVRLGTDAPVQDLAQALDVAQEAFYPGRPLRLREAINYQTYDLHGEKQETYRGGEREKKVAEVL